MKVNLILQVNRACKLLADVCYVHVGTVFRLFELHSQLTSFISGSLMRLVSREMCGNITDCGCAASRCTHRLVHSHTQKHTHPFLFTQNKRKTGKTELWVTLMKRAGWILTRQTLTAVASSW